MLAQVYHASVLTPRITWQIIVDQTPSGKPARGGDDLYLVGCRMMIGVAWIPIELQCRSRACTGNQITRRQRAGSRGLWKTVIQHLLDRVNGSHYLALHQL